MLVYIPYMDPMGIPMWKIWDSHRCSGEGPGVPQWGTADATYVAQWLRGIFTNEDEGYHFQQWRYTHITWKKTLISPERSRCWWFWPAHVAFTHNNCRFQQQKLGRQLQPQVRRSPAKVAGGAVGGLGFKWPINGDVDSHTQLCIFFAGVSTVNVSKIGHEYVNFLLGH